MEPSIITQISPMGVAVLGGIPAILASILGYKKFMAERRDKLSAEKKADAVTQELQAVTRGLTYPEFLVEWGTLEREITKLMDESNVDRFIILQARNGMYKPTHTTALFQIRQGLQEPVPYNWVKLDSDYQQRLIEIQKIGPQYYVVQQMPEDALIRSIYEAEGVHSSAWYPLNAEQDGDHVWYTYCSYATHDPAGLSKEDLIKCRLVSDRLSHIQGIFPKVEE